LRLSGGANDRRNSIESRNYIVTCLQLLVPRKLSMAGAAEPVARHSVRHEKGRW